MANHPKEVEGGVKKEDPSWGIPAFVGVVVLIAAVGGNVIPTFYLSLCQHFYLFIQMYSARRLMASTASTTARRTTRYGTEPQQ
jgi:hypothetical protein